MTLLGNIVVSWGWFGAHLFSVPGGDSTLLHSLLLLVGVAFSLGFFFVGLAPAGWLRSRKAG